MGPAAQAPALAGSEAARAVDVKTKPKPLIAAAIILAAAIAAPAASPVPSGATVLGIQGGKFVLNGAPAFLLGFSYS